MEEREREREEKFQRFMTLENASFLDLLSLPSIVEEAEKAGIFRIPHFFFRDSIFPPSLLGRMNWAGKTKEGRGLTWLCKAACHFKDEE